MAEKLEYTHIEKKVWKDTHLIAPTPAVAENSGETVLKIKEIPLFQVRQNPNWTF